MAYVTIDWEYGDTSTIEGFRIYRDDELRAEVAPNIRTVNDSVDDTNETRVKYEVKAYDSLGRESYGCQYAEVLLLSKVTPNMTSQNEPAGNAYVSFTGVISNIYDGWANFDGDDAGNSRTRINFANADGAFTVTWTYEFSEATRVAAWGYRQYFDHLNGTIDIDKLELYGSNDYSNYTKIAEISYDKGLADQTKIIRELDNPVYYKSYRFHIAGTESGVNYFDKDASFFNEFYLMNRDEVV